MTYQDKFEELVSEYIDQETISVLRIQKEKKVGFKLAYQVYKEWHHYHDEIFWHNAIYEISFMEEPPTPSRIMNEFDISYYFAKELFDYYMEII